MILTDAKGVPFQKPVPEDFPEGIEGTIAWVRAFHAYKDAIADCSNDAFGKAFQKSV